MRLVAALLCFGVACCAADYNGPRPTKPDVPFLWHADKILETETTEAKQETKKDDVTYVIDGTASPAKTPLAEPVFLFESLKLSPEKLELYRLEVKNGRREITMNSKKPKNNPRPLRMLVTRLDERLYKIEVSETLENGQYSLSPSDSDRAFCFEVY